MEMAHLHSRHRNLLHRNMDHYITVQSSQFCQDFTFPRVGFISSRFQPFKSIFQERRGDGLKRKATRLKSRQMQGQLGRAPFSTKGLVSSTRADAWGTPQQLHTGIHILEQRYNSLSSFST